jgi:hypothetical protein
MSKTNFEYLKDICAGNDEAIEFIEAAEKQHTDLQDLYKKEQEDNRSLTSENDELEGRVTEFEEGPAYPNTIKAGIGEINWQSDNLQLQLVMEALGQKITSVGALKVLRLLDIRPKPALS